MKESTELTFEDWYWGSKYAAKAVCIKAVEESDLSEEEKKIRIEMHKRNMGKTR